MDRHPTPARAYMEVKMLKMKVEIMRKNLALSKLKCLKIIELHEKLQHTATQNQ